MLQNAWRASLLSSEWKYLIFWGSVRCGYIFMLLRNKSSKSSNKSDFPSKVGSDAVRAFGMGSVVESILSAPNSVLAAAGRSLVAG